MRARQHGPPPPCPAPAPPPAASPPEEGLSLLAAQLRALADSLPDPADCAHTFSPKFQRRMARLIRRHRHKSLYRGLRRAA